MILLTTYKVGVGTVRYITMFFKEKSVFVISVVRLLKAPP